MSPSSKTRTLSLLLFAVAGLLAGALGGCSRNELETNQYLDRRDAIELSAGDANASNIAVQTVDPWPRYAGNNRIAYSGQRMQAAVERYRTNQVTPPVGISPSSVYQPSAPAAAAPSSNAAPVGPTVTQVK